MTIDRRSFCRTMVLTGLAASVPAAARQRAQPGTRGPSIARIGAAMRSGETSAAGQVDQALARITAGEPKLNAFISLFAGRARQEAAALDAERAAGKIRGPLHGIVLSVKDNIDTGGERTTGGSPVYQMRVPAEDAPSIARLRAAGAIVIGKNNLNELAMSDGRQSFYGRVSNPWAPDRQTGGSSSGSCAAVASGMVSAAIGTDTGGSIRNPASWCGVVGLKPTSGLVSNRGTLPLSPSLDTIGPIAGCVEDAAILLGALAGYDRLDITSEDHPADDYVAAMRQPVQGMKVARLLGHFDRLAPDVALAMDAAIATIARLVGGAVGEAALPDGGKAMALMPFGETFAWYRDDLEAHRYLFSSVDRATLDSLGDTKAVDYIQAQWEMERLRRVVNDAFASTDLMLFPTTHVTAPLFVKDAPADPDGARAPSALFDAGLLNVLGLPGLSLRCGFDRDGLPIGLCIVGPRFGEGKMLALAHAYETATGWHERMPAIRV